MKRTSIKELKELVSGKKQRSLLYRKKAVLLASSTLQACIQMASIAMQPVTKLSESMDKLVKASAMAEIAVNHANNIAEIFKLKK